jgi:uncharacterized coiled-coil protein SlyX
MDYNALIIGIIGAATVINSGLVVWNFIQSPSKKNAESLSALQKDVAELERRLGAQDVALKQMPTKEAVHELQLATEKMSGRLDVLNETLKAVKETSNLMRDWLLEHGLK